MHSDRLREKKTIWWIHSFAIWWNWVSPRFFAILGPFPSSFSEFGSCLWRFLKFWNKYFNIIQTVIQYLNISIDSINKNGFIIHCIGSKWLFGWFLIHLSFSEIVLSGSQLCIVLLITSFQVCEPILVVALHCQIQEQLALGYLVEEEWYRYQHLQVHDVVSDETKSQVFFTVINTLHLSKTDVAVY